MRKIGLDKKRNSYMGRKLVKILCTIIWMYIVTTVCLLLLTLFVFMKDMSQSFARAGIMFIYVLVGMSGGFFWRNAMRAEFYATRNCYSVPGGYLGIWIFISVNFGNSENRGFIHILIISAIVISSYILGSTFCAPRRRRG